VWGGLVVADALPIDAGRIGIFGYSMGSSYLGAGESRWLDHAGYDHGDYFIATFMADHLAHHAGQLQP
jgi:S-formylglutathione hydrolase FrmB